MVTLCAPDLDAAEHAYVDWLGYEVAGRGTVTAGLAGSWIAPQAVGSRLVLLRAPASPGFSLRIIERPDTPGYAVLRTHGWNANEILAADPQALATRFAGRGSPFRVIGSPAPLASNPAIVAMQALGPAGELNYFTRLPPGGGTYVKTPARSAVDRSFILVLGGASMAAMQAFYRDALGLTVTPSYASAVGVLQAAHGLPDEATTRLALVPLSPAFALELDQYPQSAAPRPRRAGDLPPGIAMVSFLADPDALGRAAPGLPWLAAPASRAEPPYGGRRAGLLRGAAGEWLELIEDR
jgi:catechol 2,3-dioxygenase-like lactoylglutathione lyase family enzyme